MNDTWDILTSPDSSPTKKVRWFARGPRDSTLQNLGGIVYSPEELKNLTNVRGYNMYVTLNPTTDRICKRISTEDVTTWAFVLLDLDPLNPVTEDTAVGVGLRFRDKLNKSVHSELYKAAIIYSGRGVQLWVRLSGTNFDSADTHDAQHYSRSAQGFLDILQKHVPEGWKMDPLSDMPRIARMPNTVNQKTGYTAYIVDTGGIAKYTLTEFILQQYRPLPEYAIAVSSLKSYNREWTDVRNDLTLRAKTFLDLGATAGNRHESCWVLCKNLHEHGVTKWSAMDALQHGNRSCMAELTDRELQEILEQVYGRQ